MSRLVMVYIALVLLVVLALLEMIFGDPKKPLDGSHWNSERFSEWWRKLWHRK